MSIELIRTKANERLSTLLANAKELVNIFDIASNEENLLNNGYCTKWGQGRPAQSCTRQVGFNSPFIVTLTRANSVRISDNVNAEVGSIYSDVNKVIASFMNDTYLGIPSNMRGIRSVSFSDPIVLHGGEFTQIDIEFLFDFVINIDYS